MKTIKLQIDDDVCKTLEDYLWCKGATGNLDLIDEFILKLFSEIQAGQKSTRIKLKK